MKTIIVSILTLISVTAAKGQTTAAVDFKNSSFEQLFREIKPTEIDANVFSLIGEQWSVITAGTTENFNSMIASWGGCGMLFEKPTAWIFLNANRFTLEHIRKTGSFTLSYLDSTYNDQKMILGSLSGRNSNKMARITLDAVATPESNMTYKQAYMVFELTVDGIIELDPDKFRSENSRTTLEAGRKSGNGTNYHQMVTGVITRVWVRR